MILDVGCGTGKSYHFNPPFEANVFIDIEKPSWNIENFIMGDVCHLPFKNDIFERVYCSHVIEHVDNPVLAIKELIRTSKKYVLIRTPHKYSKDAKKDKNHKSFFNITWFNRLFDRLKVFYKIEVSRENRFFVLSMPSEIRIKVKKKLS